MTRALTGQPAPLAASRTRQGGGLIGLAWLTWRQHRWIILVGVLGLGLFTAYLLWLDHEIARQVALCGGSCGRQLFSAEFSTYVTDADIALAMLVFASPLVAAFVAAPLVSREYEQRTNLLVWSQDVRATRWLATKTALLATIGAVLAGIVGFAASALAHRLDGLRAKEVGSSALFLNYFDLTPAMQVGYMLFGFALGLVMSVVARRTLPAMGSTLVLFIATRYLVGRERPRFMSPMRHIVPLAQSNHNSLMAIGDYGLYVDNGYADAAGNPVPRPAECFSATITTAPHDAPRSQEIMQSCLRDHGIAFEYIDYQPGSRLGTFHLIEEVIFVGLAAVLFVLAWWRVRRAITIG